MKYKPVRFISETIEVVFDKPPVIEKKPGCPDFFRWHGDTFHIIEVVSEWYDYQRRGRMARNMIPTHAMTAELRGSWGVGQYYFRVVTEQGRIFDIYYDRAPKDADHRKGSWFIYRELVVNNEPTKVKPEDLK